jgi:hypothetical protein
MKLIGNVVVDGRSYCDGDVIVQLSHTEWQALLGVSPFDNEAKERRLPAELLDRLRLLDVFRAQLAEALALIPDTKTAP